MDSYTNEELDLIRRAIEKYRTARGGRGLPTTCMEINRWHDPQTIGSINEPLNLKTLQRFVSGNRIRPGSVRLIKEFMDAMEPMEDVERIGDAAAGLFSTMFASMTGDGALGDKLARNLAASYDVFLEGRATTRDPNARTPDFWVPKYPDREYIWDQPFEISYSRISFIREPYADWLRVVERVHNTEMDSADESWVDSQVYKGVLAVAGLDSFYSVFLKDEALDHAKFYALEPDQNTWGEPVEKQKLVGGMLGYAGQKFTTTIGARQVMLVPARSNEPLPGHSTS